jgi:hypothetical protein
VKSPVFPRPSFFLVVALLGTPCVAWAAPSVEATKIDRVTVGLGGVFKVGRWTTLTAQLESSATGPVRLEVDAPDPEGSVVTFQSLPVSLTSLGPNSVSVPFKMGRLAGTLGIRVVGQNGVLASRQLRVSGESEGDIAPPLRQSVFLLAHVRPAGAASGLSTDRITQLLSNEAASPEGNAAPTARPNIEVVDIEAADSLPANSEGYSAIDAILLDGQLALNLAQSQALEGWVRAGGHLVVTLGKAAPTFAKTPLAAWIPVKVQGMARLGDLSAIESFCRQSTRIMSASDEPVDAARLNDGGNQSLISTFEGSLMCRASCGLGRVTVLGVGFDNPLLVRWTGMAEFLRRLLDLEDTRSKRAQSLTTRLTQTGITELATQLDSTQDEFPSIARVTTWPVMGLMVALLLVIGPIDYLLVHKLFNRPELTWITFPLIVAAAAASAVWWGSAAKGNRLLANQLDIFDADTASGVTHVRSCSVLYSPENRRYNVSVDPESIQAIAPSPDAKKADQKATLRVGWHGRPESSFGGMYRAGGAEIARPPYSIEADDRTIDGVPIAIWSSKNLETDWLGNTSNLVDCQLESRGPSRLEGSLRHHFPVPIEDWVVAYGHQVFRPRTDAKTGLAVPLLPDVPWLPLTASQRELNGYLTGATKVNTKSINTQYEESHIEHADYDPLDRDPVNIVRMLTFHREAGSTLYTGLENGALRNFDWTPLLDLDRAVLIGAIRKPVIRWTVDGKQLEPETQVTIVRLLLPVRKTHDE